MSLYAVLRPEEEEELQFVVLSSVSPLSLSLSRSLSFFSSLSLSSLLLFLALSPSCTCQKDCEALGISDGLLHFSQLKSKHYYTLLYLLSLSLLSLTTSITNHESGGFEGTYGGERVSTS